MEFLVTPKLSSGQENGQLVYYHKAQSQLLAELFDIQDLQNKSDRYPAMLTARALPLWDAEPYMRSHGLGPCKGSAGNQVLDELGEVCREASCQHYVPLTCGISIYLGDTLP